ncbi:MAG: GTP cyclohydrolase I FolE [Candidatus Firestonebacteria bacterium]|nr:GTP cyclohydrolase I FolE [Candidatus Firestonebacteria bacterium]
MSKIDKEKIKRATVMLLEAIGDDPEREGLIETPERVADMYEEIFGGVFKNPEEELKIFSTKNKDEMILVKDIPLYSICEHHLLPFIGKAHVAYIPSQNKITGLSKVARVVDTLARRPQIQERLTTDIADVFVKKLKPKGVLVVIEAEHMCMIMRGIKKPGSFTVTSAMRGIFREAATRSEAFALIKG